MLGGGAGGGAAGTKTPAGTVETGVKAATGVGASDGLPTTNDAGQIDMTLHQINQDGAGPFTAQVDGTSGGTDVGAFQKAEVTKNVPGIAAGLSTATVSLILDFRLFDSSNQRSGGRFPSANPNARWHDMQWTSRCCNRRLCGQTPEFGSCWYVLLNLTIFLHD